MKAGDLIYVPATVTLMEFDEKLADIDLENTYVGPSPLRCHSLDKPTNLLLLEDYNEEGGQYLQVLYRGEKAYINKHDVLPYQEEKWFS